MFSTLPADDADLAAGTPALARLYLHQADVDATLHLFEGTIYSRDALIQGFIALSTWSSVDRLATIAVPTFVAVGRHDVVTSFPQADRIADRIPNSERIVFEHSGHVPWIDEPDAFFSAIERWLGSRCADQTKKSVTPSSNKPAP